MQRQRNYAAARGAALAAASAWNDDGSWAEASAGWDNWDSGRQVALVARVTMSTGDRSDLWLPHSALLIHLAGTHPFTHPLTYHHSFFKSIISPFDHLIIST